MEQPYCETKYINVYSQNEYINIFRLVLSCDARAHTPNFPTAYVDAHFLCILQTNKKPTCIRSINLTIGIGALYSDTLSQYGSCIWNIRFVVQYENYEYAVVHRLCGVVQWWRDTLSHTNTTQHPTAQNLFII